MKLIPEKMEFKIRNYLIFKLILILICLAGAIAILTFKILDQSMFKKQSSLSIFTYLPCESYLRFKYYVYMDSMMDAVSSSVITSIFFLICLGFSQIYFLFIVKQQNLSQLTNSKIFLFQFIEISITLLGCICISGYSASFFVQSKRCKTVTLDKYFLPIIIIPCIAVLLILIYAINMYLMYKQRQINPPKNLLEQEQQKIKKYIQNDRNSTYYPLLSPNKRIDQILTNGFELGNKFSQFQKQYQTKYNQNIFDPNQQNYKINDKIQPPQEIIKEQFSKQKIQQLSKQNIQKLNNIGYEGQKIQGQEKIIMTKKFGPSNKNSPIRNQGRQNNGNLSTVHQQDQNNDDQRQMQIKLQLDTSKPQNIKNNTFKEEDLQNIELDQRQLKLQQQKQNKQKSQKRRQILRLRFKEQLNKKKMLEQHELNRLRWNYQHYIDEDSTISKQFQQMQQYSSKKRGQFHNLMKQQLIFCMKPNAPLVTNQQTEQINKQFQYESIIRYPQQIFEKNVQKPAFSINIINGNGSPTPAITKKQSQHSKVYTNLQKGKRKQLIQFVRGKFVL